jgi:hypothetical protein
MTSHHDQLKGLTPEELLGWLRAKTAPLDLDESSEALFGEFMYQVPYWERSGYWDVQATTGGMPASPRQSLPSQISFGQRFKNSWAIGIATFFLLPLRSRRPARCTVFTRSMSGLRHMPLYSAHK